MKRKSGIGARLARRFLDGIENSPPLSGPHIKMLLKSFFWLLGALLVLYARGAVKQEAAFDFASYLLPCVAGGLAGAGLIFRGPGAIDAQTGEEAQPHSSNERLNYAASEAIRLKRMRIGRDAVFYALSVLALYVGIILYAMAHKTCRASAITLCGVFCLLPVARIILGRMFDESMAYQRGYADGVLFLSILVVMAVITVALLIYGPALWVNIDGRYLCSDQG